MVKVIDYFGYNNPFIKIKTFFSCKAREKMYKKFEEFIEPNKEDEILDLGVTPDMTLKDSNFFEKRYPYKNRITISSIENCEFLKIKYGLKCFIKNKTKEKLPFRDKQFDILFCSAVLEHVGSREDQKLFLQECLRVSKKIFITTPNRYFPIEMHTFIPFLHWLPWKFFQKIVLKIKGEFWADINNLNLLSRRNIKEMFKNDTFEIHYIKTLGWKSNIIIIHR